MIQQRSLINADALSLCHSGIQTLTVGTKTLTNSDTWDSGTPGHGHSGHGHSEIQTLGVSDTPGLGHTLIQTLGTQIFGVTDA